MDVGVSCGDDNNELDAEGLDSNETGASCDGEAEAAASGRAGDALICGDGGGCIARGGGAGGGCVGCGGVVVVLARWRTGATRGASSPTRGVSSLLEELSLDRTMVSALGGPG